MQRKGNSAVCVVDGSICNCKPGFQLLVYACKHFAFGDQMHRKYKLGIPVFESYMF